MGRPLKAKRFFAVFAAAALALAGALFTGCAQEDGYIEYSLAENVYVDGERLPTYAYAELAADTDAAVREAERLLAADGAESDIARINAAEAGQPVAVDGRTYALLSLCKTLCEQTDGAFSPALYALSDLWGFTPAYEGKYTLPRPAPDEELVRQALLHADFSKIELRGNNTVVKTDGQTQLDLGGVAKGYMTDLVAQRIAERYPNRETEYSVQIMSNLLLAGRVHEGEKERGYNIGIYDPRVAVTGSIQCLFLMNTENVAVSTSSDEFLFYVYEGKIYPHIIDPATGAPASNGVISATVCVPLSVPYAGACADAYSTAAFCMPLTATISFFEDLYAQKGVRAVLLTQDHRYYTIGYPAPERAQTALKNGEPVLLEGKDYAAAIGSSAAPPCAYTYADAADARDEVIPCAEELRYIAQVTELSK